jgi:hypothetical protein
MKSWPLPLGLQQRLDNVGCWIYLSGDYNVICNSLRFRQIGVIVFAQGYAVSVSRSKAFHSSCLSVRPSVSPFARIEQLGSHWTDLDKIWYLIFARKFILKIQLSLKLTIMTDALNEKPIYVYDNISLNSFKIKIF